MTEDTVTLSLYS